MSAIETMLRQPAAQAIGWALLHFLWQGTLVALLTAITLVFLRRSAADVRYVVSAVALSVMLTLPAVTAVQVWRSSPDSPAMSAGPKAGTSGIGSVDLQVSPAAGSPFVGSAGLPWPEQSRRQAGQTGTAGLNIPLDPWLPVIVLAWLCGVVVLSLRLISGWLWVQRMKTHGTQPARDGWQVIAARLARRLHITRGVTLLESRHVDVPTVIGWIRPVILLPMTALSGLAPHQLEAILAHELAHIRRHDYLVNLLQTLVETLLFYHPAVWWLSRRIRVERENCCDDLAVSLCGDPFLYAQALADLEERRGGRPELALAATGGSLLQRVRRLLGAPTHEGRAPGWLAGSVSVLVMFGIVAGAVGTDAFQSPAATSPPSQEVAAGMHALEASAKALANEIRFTWDAVVHGARRNARQVEVEQQAQALTAAVHRLQPHVAALQDHARATAAAAEAMERKARLYGQAAAAAAWLQDVTGQASTPIVAGQTLAAQAAAFKEAARSMAAEAETARPAIAAPPSPVAFSIERSGQTHATITSEHNGQKLEVRLDGDVEFTDDDADVKRLTPGGLLRIKDDGFLSSVLRGRAIEFSADANGNITRRFWVGSSERPFEPEGRQWLAQVLPHFIRQTGIGAPARVARILKSRGPSGVLAEISLIEGSWAKRVYFSELLKTSIDAATTRQALVQAGREIDSDFELATLLIQASDRLLVDDATRQAYFDAARTIQSDFEMHRVYSAALKRGPVSPPLLASLLTASRDIDSDFEEATLLIEVAKLQPLDNTTRGPFFDALATVASDFEHRRVLSAVAERTQLTPDVTAAMLTSAAGVNSDFELASFLLQLVKQQPIEGTLRAPFFRAVDSIDSAFERGRVLQAVAHRSDLSPETVLEVLRSTAGVKSNFEASGVLLAVASTHPVSGPARDAYIDIAEKLGDFEQGRALSALVRNERRK
jgi:beta-lactamase regulating signal transducer with metallopeptidase domain